MGKLHDKLNKLGWDKVHRSFHESDDVHVREGSGEIVGEALREEHGAAYVKGRQDLKELKGLERVGQQVEMEGELEKFGWDVGEG